MRSKVMNAMGVENSPCNWILNAGADVVYFNFLRSVKRITKKFMNTILRSRLLPINFYPVAVLQAAAIIKLTTISTGIKSVTFSFRPYMVRKIPLPTAANRPVQPFKLSNHPGTGSFRDGITAKRTTILMP